MNEKTKRIMVIGFGVGATIAVTGALVYAFGYQSGYSRGLARGKANVIRAVANDFIETGCDIPEKLLEADFSKKTRMIWSAFARDIERGYV